MSTKEDRVKMKIYKDFQVKYFSGRGDGKTSFVQLNQDERREFCSLQRKYVEEEYQRIKYGLVTIAKGIGKDAADEAYKLFVNGIDLNKLDIKHSLKIKTIYLGILRKFGLEKVVNQT